MALSGQVLVNIKTSNFCRSLVSILLLSRYMLSKLKVSFVVLTLSSSVFRMLIIAFGSL